MPKPQQPELRRSGRGATSDDSAKLKADHDSNDVGLELPEETVPPENRPGHHPAAEQDRPPPDRLPDAPDDD